MKNELVSLLSIILGLIIIAFPMLGVISISAIIGLSILLMSILLLIVGISIIDYNTSGAILDISLGIIMLILSLGIIFNPSLFAFLTAITLYLAGIFLIVIGLVALINNRSSKFGFWIGISGIVLGLLYIIVGSYISNPLILGSLIGVWLLITGVFKFLDR